MSATKTIREVAAIVIAIITALVMWLLDLVGITLGSGLLGLIVLLVVAAVVLLLAGHLAAQPGWYRRFDPVTHWSGSIT